MPFNFFKRLNKKPDHYWSIKSWNKAVEDFGVKEWGGSRHNPVVVEYFREIGHSWIKDDETAWCAAFVGAILKRVGLPHTGKLNARSYLNWGEPVALEDAQKGDVVVFWRGSRSGWQGHVGFFSEQVGNNISVLGGNQGNSVSISPYSKNKLLGIRRYSVAS